MQVSLADRDIWIIDDDIPIDRWELADPDLLMGTRPIDRGTLLAMLPFEDWWDDPQVRALCGQLVTEAGTITAFRHPSSAIRHLERGASIPDVVVFDLDYRMNPPGARSPLDLLEQMLAQCMSVVQVYTKMSLEEACRRLEPLRGKFSMRLASPRDKSETRADQLVGVMEDRLENSLSARLAKRIRHSSSVAIEEVLTKIDDLPLDVAVRLLAGGAEIPKEMEFVELLSARVGAVLESASDLAAVLEEFVVKRGVPAERVKEAVCEIVSLLSSSVREHILYDGGLFAEITSACEAATQAQETGDEAESWPIVQEFFAFRLYDQPKDSVVRTGDIILLPSEKKTSPDDPPYLYLILTPPCDLAYFWYNTRGVLTLARMCPATDDRGIMRVRSYEHGGFDSSSVTASNPIVLPSVPLTKEKPFDYLLFLHEIRYLECDGLPLVEGIEIKKHRKARFKRQLTYEELTALGIGLEQKCRVSEPFLSGILAALRDKLFRGGVPDFPDEETKRLKDLGLFR